MIMLFVEIILLSVAAKLLSKRGHFHPALIIPLFIIFVIYAPVLYYLKQGLDFSLGGLEVLGFLIASFQFGAILGDTTIKKKGFKNDMVNKKIYLGNRFKFFHTVSVVLAVLAFFLVIKEVSSTFKLSYNFEELMLMSTLNSGARYSGVDRTFSNSTFYFTSFFNASLILSSIATALNIYKNKLYGRILLAISIFLNVFYTFVEGTKAMTTAAAFFFFSSYYLTLCLFVNERNFIITKKRIFTSSIVVFLFIGIFYLSYIVRIGANFNDRDVNTTNHSITNYLTAHTLLFCNWVHTYDFSKLTLGAYTFAGIFDQLDFFKSSP